MDLNFKVLLRNYELLEEMHSQTLKQNRCVRIVLACAREVQIV